MARSHRSRYSAPSRTLRTKRLQLEELEDRHLLSGVQFHPLYIVNSRPADTSGVVGLTPAQMRTAYGFDKLSFNGVPADGRGQTIAIIDAYDAPTLRSDLDVFDQTFGLPAPPSFQIVNQTGGSTLPPTDPDKGWEGETALDVEWAHAIAPGANILLIEANTAFDSDLFAAVNYARHVPGVSAISMSWGGDDFFDNMQLMTLLNSQIMVTPPGHAGVTFVVSAGDTSQASSPSTFPNALSIGGTLLALNGDNTIAHESAWGSESFIDGGGGGISQIFNKRATPDVSYNADPASGVAVYDTFGPEGTGWVQIGGTSAGAPQWAALMAIVNQGRALAGYGPLDGPSQTIPALYSAPTGDLRDIIDGRNFYQIAAPGYDYATGLGSPSANLLVPYLVNYGTPASVNTPSGPTIPPVFGAGATSSSSALVNWSAVPGATSYSLYERVNNQTVLVGTYGAGTTSATVTGLPAGATASFSLVVSNSAGSVSTSWVNVTTPAAVLPPVAPLGFAGSSTSSSSITFTWNPSAGATTYNLYQWKNGSATLAGTYPAGTTTATISGLNSGTTYAFYLAASNSGGSASTAWIGVATRLAATLPAAPQNFTVTATDSTSVQISWIPSATATGYSLYQTKNGQSQLVGTYTAGTTSATLGGLVAGSTNSFSLAATNASGSTSTAWTTVTLPAPAAPPSAPLNFKVGSVSATSVQFTWSAATGAMGYTLYQIKNSQLVLVGTYPVGTTSATVSGLTAGSTSLFSLAATNSGGSTSTFWLPVTASAAVAPSVPQAFTATSNSSTTVQLSWSGASGVTSYSVYQKVNSQSVLVGTYAAGTTSATISGLLAGTTYSFNLVASNAAGSAATNWVTTSTLAAAASVTAPQNFSGASASSTSIQLSWSASAGANGYRLYEWINNQVVLVGTYAAGTTSALISNLKAGTPYQFILTAVGPSNTATTSWIGVSTRV